MSDRTPSSVRTGSRGDGGAPTDNAPAEAVASPPPVTSTQAIPTTGSQRAQGPATGASAATSAPAQPAGAPPVPPATGSAPAVPPSAATAPGPGTQPSAVPPGAPAADPGAPPRVRGRTAKSRGPRRARLQLRHIDTWSALKISLVLSIALFFIWMVAVAVLYGVLSALGVFDTLNDLFGQLSSASGSGGGKDVITPGIVFGGAAVIGAINVILMTALCTVGTFIYK